MTLKPNKKYNAHLDNEYLNYKDEIFCPWVYLKNNYVITDHFVKRCEDRDIRPKTITRTLREGKKYFTIEDDVLVTKHVLDNRIVVEKERVLMTVVFFGRGGSAKVERFIKDEENFVFEIE